MSADVLHRDASFEALGVVRIVVFALVALHAALTPLEDLAALPSVVFEPMGVLRLIPVGMRAALWSAAGLGWLRAALLGLAVGCAWGVRGYRLWAPACALCLLLFEGTLLLGATSHRALGLIGCVLVLSVVPAHAAFSIGPVRPRPAASIPSVALGVMTFCLLFSYALTAFYRVAHGAPAVFFDHSMAAHLVSNAGRNGAFGWAFGQRLVDGLGPDNPVLGMMLLAGTLLETLAPLSVFSRRFRRVFVVAIVGFHLANVVLLNIEFFFNCVLVPLLLLEWGRLIPPGRPAEVERQTATRSPSTT